MAKKRYRRKGKETHSLLLELGIKALLASVALLFVTTILQGSTLFSTLATGLVAPAWMALAASVVLLGLHALTKKKTAADETPDSPLAGASRSPATNPVQNKVHPANAEVRSQEPHWSAAVFTAIEWRRFEAVCEALFAQAGFETRSQSHGADGGVDIWLHSRNATGPVSMVQCKHWQGKPVGVKELREFFGVMASNGLKRGTYATTSTYTAAAFEFAKANGISALDGAALLNLIAKRTPEQQATLLNVAYEGEYWKPTCASCGIKLVEREPGKGGAKFWGCANYPRCKSRIYKTAQA